MNNIDQIIHSTCRLECIDKEEHKSYGTTFLFSFENKGKYHPVFVTNKHVIKDSKVGRFIFTKINPHTNLPIYGEKIEVNLANFESLWIKHPDESIDICVMPFNKIPNSKIKEIYIKGFSEYDILDTDRKYELSAFEEIFMIGYPNALWDQYNNLPIIRRGTTATHPNINYNNKPEFMIDIASFPGSSGSPVYMDMGGLRILNDSSAQISMGSEIKLLGIMYAGPMFNIFNEVEVEDIPTKSVITQSQIPMNLGLVIKIEKLLEMKPLLFKQPLFKW